ncbi:hypothetical protein ABPG72_009382 [Tetrahymena utriculariae]
MEEKTNFQINFNSYLFQIELLSDNKINITASNSIEGELYELFNHKLEKIQSKCIIPALEEKAPQTLLAKITYGQNHSLILEIIVKYDFIPEMRETIEISRKEVDNDEKLKLLLKQSQKNLYDLQVKLEETKSSKKLAHHKDVLSFKNQGTFLKLDLTPGDYEITFNFFAKSDSNFVDVQFYIDNKQTDAVPNNGFYFNKAQGNQFYPFTLKSVVQLDKNSTLSVQTSGKQKLEAKEMVLLAEKITKLSKQD